MMVILVMLSVFLMSEGLKSLVQGSPKRVRKIEVLHSGVI